MEGQDRVDGLLYTIDDVRPVVQCPGDVLRAEEGSDEHPGQGFRARSLTELAQALRLRQLTGWVQRRWNLRRSGERLDVQVAHTLSAEAVALNQQLAASTMSMTTSLNCCCPARSQL